MGGTGSGRKSIKSEAIKCLLDVQLRLVELLYEGFDDKNKTRDDLQVIAEQAFKRTKSAQEEIERL